jgi:oligoendopeptidase F
MSFKHKGIVENGRKSKPIKLFTKEELDIELNDNQLESLNRRVRKKHSEKESYGYWGIVCCTNRKKSLRSTSIWKHLN